MLQTLLLAVMLVAPAFGQASSGVILPDAAHNSWDEWSKKARKEVIKEREEAQHYQDRLRHEYEVRVAITVVGSASIVAIAIAAFFWSEYRKRGVLSGLSIILAALVWLGLWFSQSTEYRLFDCKQEAASRRTESGVRIALKNCESLYGVP
jgi:hypothetical protein